MPDNARGIINYIARGLSLSFDPAVKYIPSLSSWGKRREKSPTVCRRARRRNGLILVVTRLWGMLLWGLGKNEAGTKSEEMEKASMALYAGSCRLGGFSSDFISYLRPRWHIYTADLTVTSSKFKMTLSKFKITLSKFKITAFQQLRCNVKRKSSELFKKYSFFLKTFSKNRRIFQSLPHSLTPVPTPLKMTIQSNLITAITINLKNKEVSPMLMLIQFPTENEHLIGAGIVYCIIICSLIQARAKRVWEQTLRKWALTFLFFY